MSLNKILTAANAELEITNLYGDKTTSLLAGEPLGTVGESATGEIGEKVIVIGDKTTGSKQFTGSSAAAISSSATALDLTTAGRSGVLQNLSTDPLFVKYGAGASATSFNFILPGCTVQDDGTSPPVTISDWVGLVSVFSNTTIRHTATVLY